MGKLLDGDRVQIADGGVRDGEEGRALLVGVDRALIALPETAAGPALEAIWPRDQLRRVISLDKLVPEERAELAELETKLAALRSALADRLAYADDPEPLSWSGVVRAVVPLVAELLSLIPQFPPELRGPLVALAERLARAVGG